MKTRIIAIALIGAALSTGCGCGNSGSRAQSQEQKEPIEEQTAPVQDSVTVYENEYLVKVGDMAPDFEVELTDGQKIRLSELKGKLVMLQFTASWCGVCRKEMPEIEKQIWLPHKDNDAFVLIGVDRDEPLETVKEFAARIGVTYPLGLDPDGRIFSEYALKESGITRNVLIDEEGKIVRLTRGYKVEEFQELVKDIESRLARLTDTQQN